MLDLRFSFCTEYHVNDRPIRKNFVQFTSHSGM